MCTAESSHLSKVNLHVGWQDWLKTFQSLLSQLHDKNFNIYKLCVYAVCLSILGQ